MTRSASVAQLEFIHTTPGNSNDVGVRRSSPHLLAASPEVVAVGECGLDYFRNFSPRAAQTVDSFRQQLDLAVQVRKPVFLHQRDAHDEFLGVLREYGSRLVGGVAHCFTAGSRRGARVPRPGVVHRHHRLDLRMSAAGLHLREGRARDPGGAAC